VLTDPSQAYNVDYRVLESTYGDRLHATTPPSERLASVVNESLARGGVLLIPSFAVGRTQTLLYILRELEEKRAIPSLPVYVDSPMSINATEIFRAHIPDLDITSRMLSLKGTDVFRPKKLSFCKSKKESMALNELRGGAIIISSSGMATGGRILHHLRQRLPHADNTVLFIGYQAEGTRGRSIMDGERAVKIHGDFIPVNAHVESISGFSGHGDYDEIMGWLMGFNRAPEKTFIVHGEPSAAASLADKIRGRFGWDVVIPSFGETYELVL
jgi:metallo-beta-lactamase family protein